VFFGGRGRVKEHTQSLAATSADDETLFRIIEQLLSPVHISTINEFLLLTFGGSCEDLETQLAVISYALLPILVDFDSDLFVRRLKFLDCQSNN